MEKSISVIFPVFNEKESIESVVDSTIKFLPSIANHYEVIVVDDGSRDGTGRLIDRLAKKYNQVIALHHLSNRGYGATLRSGFKTARGELIFFTDGDGQFDIREIPKLVNLIKKGTDIACGYRIKRADVLMRVVNAAIYNTVVRLLFGLNMKDIDCAFKLFKRKVIDDIKLETNGAFINAEFLILAKKKGYIVKQIGVSHYPREKGKQTGNNVMVVFRVMIELIKFWIK